MLTKMYINVTEFLEDYKNDERGVTAIEYGLIGVAMATLLGVVFASSGDDSLIGNLTAAFAKITSTISSVKGS
ncbi:MAG: Flp family type IVb pilin [Moritella sp.]|uniref:Flp family type IVb pilin n=1 Tax=Moritella sp. TaxID=78556 RepID=UPI001D42E2DB|nr:Flp family type IVb pilin [Moritella sp.]NQZ51287.1 Flp family type IVb pilin [Moritella sp.]